MIGLSTRRMPDAPGLRTFAGIPVVQVTFTPAARAALDRLNLEDLVRPTERERIVAEVARLAVDAEAVLERVGRAFVELGRVGRANA